MSAVAPAPPLFCPRAEAKISAVLIPAAGFLAFGDAGSVFASLPRGGPRIKSSNEFSEQYDVNLLDHPTLKAAVKASLGKLGDYPCKAGLCFKAGIIERSRLFGLLLTGQAPDAD